MSGGGGEKGWGGDKGGRGVLAPRWDAGDWNRAIPGPSLPRAFALLCPWAEFFGPFGPLGLVEDEGGRAWCWGL